MFLFTLLMITREGMETALLMGTLLFQQTPMNIIAGAAIGTLSAAFVAWLWSRYGHRVNLGLFFQVTAVFLLVFVVQLLIYGFHELTEANIFPYSEPLHWATEPYGPDGRYGQYLTYLLVMLPLGWLAFSSSARACHGARRSGQRRGTSTHVATYGSADTLRAWRSRPTVVDLTWIGGLTFSGAERQASITLDSAGVAGPSPVQALGFALAGCMTTDVAHILTKGRHPFRALRSHLVADRSPGRTAPVRADDAARHGRRRRAGGRRRARHRAVAGEVLLGLALDAAGHRFTTTHDIRAIDAPYIDWARGIAVLLMIEAHTTDAWTRAADKKSVALPRRQHPRRLRRAAVPLARGPRGRARGDAHGRADRQPVAGGRGHRPARPRDLHPRVSLPRSRRSSSAPATTW